MDFWIATWHLVYYFSNWNKHNFNCILVIKNSVLTLMTIFPQLCLHNSWKKYRILSVTMSYSKAPWLLFSVNMSHWWHKRSTWVKFSCLCRSSLEESNTLWLMVTLSVLALGCEFQWHFITSKTSLGKSALGIGTLPSARWGHLWRYTLSRLSQQWPLVDQVEELCPQIV